jgi:hypothetical protein
MLVRYNLRGGVWLLVYLFFVLAPLFALLAGGLPPARDFWTEFSAALSYAGLAMMGLHFGLTARFHHVTEPWGEDVIYHFHRRISLIAVGLIVAHPIILSMVRPELLALLNSIQALWRARFAALSTYSLIALVVMALWRVKLNIRYETWHVTHIVLAVVAVAAGVAYMVGWSFCLSFPWKRVLWIALPAFWTGLLPYVRIIKPLFMLRRPYRVAEVRKERGDTSTLVMQPDGHLGFRLSPGQFGWLTLWSSPFKIAGYPLSFSSSAATTTSARRNDHQKFGRDPHGSGGPARVGRWAVRGFHDQTQLIGHARADRRRHRHHTDDEHNPHAGRPRRHPPDHSPLRQQGWEVHYLPRGAGDAAAMAQSDYHPRISESTARLRRARRAS